MNVFQMRRQGVGLDCRLIKHKKSKIPFLFLKETAGRLIN